MVSFPSGEVSKQRLTTFLHWGWDQTTLEGPCRLKADSIPEVLRFWKKPIRVLLIVLLWLLLLFFFENVLHTHLNQSLLVYGLPLWLSWWRICLQCGRPGLDPWVGKTLWRRERLPTSYSGLENSMDCIVHGVAKSRTRLSDFHFHFLPWFITGYGIQFPVPYRQTLLFIHPIYNSVSANPKLLISPLLPPFQLQACFPRLFLSLMKSFVSNKPDCRVELGCTCYWQDVCDSCHEQQRPCFSPGVLRDHQAWLNNFSGLNLERLKHNS